MYDISVMIYFCNVLTWPLTSGVSHWMGYMTDFRFVGWKNTPSPNPNKLHKTGAEVKP